MTVRWLDDELERYWRAPADTAAYRKGAATVDDSGERRSDADVRTATAAPAVGERSDDAGRDGGRTVTQIFEALAVMLADAEGELGCIDEIAGDGRGMVKGSAEALAAAAEAVEQGAGQGRLAAAGEE